MAAAEMTGPQCLRQAPAPGAPLIQIRRRQTATWNGLILLIESGEEEWTASVREAGLQRTLYTARRPNAAAARGAAVEFACFHAANLDLREAAASLREISWNSSW